ncbi:MAG TPA: WecB/TagA/CpsF family glycosyltransferase [Candidatus Saccharimonadia bacterium]|nr:WecB/TagA/CpsF family glycosyltransferase [Candidatus Saccharimonadia bacterium]
MDFMTLFGVPFFSGNMEQARELVLKHADFSGKPVFIVFTPNPEQIELAQKNTQFLKDLQASDLNVPDGVGVIWAGDQLHLEHAPTKRIAGRELVMALLPDLNKKKKSVFVLGGFGDTAQLAAVELKKQFPELTLEWSSGSTDLQHETPDRLNEVMQKIRAAKPNLLLVAYGAPKQERWVMEHRDELAQAGVKVAMVVGGTLDVLAGKVRATPDLFAHSNLEWAWRLIQQPWRLKRQLALLSFYNRVLEEKFRASRVPSSN